MRNKLQILFFLLIISGICHAQYSDNIPYIKINNDTNIYFNFYSFSKTEKITELEIFNFPLTEYFDSIYQFKDLKKLTLFACKFDSIPIGIGGLSQLESLHLEYTTITELPNDFINLKKLKLLHVNKHDCFGVSGCSFTIPKEIDELKELKELDFKDCSLSPLPSEFANLNLQKLRIIHSNFDSFPEEIIKLKFLESLIYIYGGGKCPQELTSRLKHAECKD